jgi:hypothetical protein
LDKNLQLFEGRQLNDGIGDDGRIEGVRVAHPRRHQHFGHLACQNAVVLDPMEDLRPIRGNGLAGKRMKRIVNDQFLRLMMGNMQ